MRIALIIEGKTETVFLPHLRAFLQTRLAGRMPKLDAVPYDGRIPTGEKLRRVVENLLGDRKDPAGAVIALTDVYTGSRPPDFVDAADAKAKMRQWVGENDRFHPHAAQHDFEAWLLVYWEKIKRLAKSNRASPGPQPERVNHIDPPAHRLQVVFRTGGRGQAYVKTRDADRILRGEDLLLPANACPELKAFLNTILKLCGGDTAMIP
jgi:hypothetical protein